MTRIDPGARAARARRVLAGAGVMLLLSLAVSACSGNAPPAPTPDPFGSLADRSDQAFRQGLELYGQGQYQEALTVFNRARVLSPTVDPRIEQMIERTQAAMAPTPTPVPPTSTPLPVVPTATPVVQSTQPPDTDLGSRYFGDVSLAVVPTRNVSSPAATEFFFQDQIALQIEGLKQHLRLPFTLRVFDSDSAALVAEVQYDDTAATVANQDTPVSVPTPRGRTAAASVPTPLVASGAVASMPTPLAASSAIKLTRFWDNYVWYHQGGETPGRYRVELFTSGILTNAIDYTVGTLPVPTPQPSVATSPTDLPVPVPAADSRPPAPPNTARPSTVQPAPVSAVAAPAAVRAEPTATREPTLVPTATPIPTPATADTTVIGGVPAGLDINSYTGRFYLADGSGFIWSADAPQGLERPTLRVPINLPASGASYPVDLAVDSSRDYLFVSMRVCPSDGKAAQVPLGCIVVVDGQSQQILSVISLPGAPGDLRVDADQGLLYVVIPDLQEIAELDIRSDKVPPKPVVDARGVPLPRVLRTIGKMPNITSLALDPVRHTLFAASLVGEVAVVDVPSGQVTARVPVTGAGLTGVAAARGLAYAVNTATHELAILDPGSHYVTRYTLNQEPAAVAASEDSGALYVLASSTSLILRIDPSDGSELGTVITTNRSAHAAIRPSDVQGLRPRLVLNPTDDAVYASFPEAGVVAAVRDTSFPVMARAIPFPDLSDQALLASNVPDALWPAAVRPDVALGR